MSIEPTCDFCGYSDKHRCKTQAQAEGCDQYRKEHLTRDIRPDRVLPNAERNALPHLSLEKDLSVGRVTVKTHQAGMIERLSVSIERPQHGSGPVHFTLQPQDIDTFIELLRKAQTYSKKGTF